MRRLGREAAAARFYDEQTPFLGCSFYNVIIVITTIIIIIITMVLAEAFPLRSAVLPTTSVVCLKAKVFWPCFTVV